ncbi:hypothetical protein ACQPZG_29370 [Streptomyces sp. CA-294286]|uniref:hypothetical protein n=1 Tax=Streptomyces sp. CA-294286 TaxID=3240070 RepID=UPI003D8E5A59
MWPGQQPPGGEQNPQDQNPYQQPGYQTPPPPGQPPAGGPQPTPPPGQPPAMPGSYQQPAPAPGYGYPAPGSVPTPPSGSNPYADHYTVPMQPGPVGPGGPKGPPDDKKKNMITAVVAGVVVVAALAATGIFVLGDKDDTQDRADGRSPSQSPTAAASQQPGAGASDPAAPAPGGSVANPRAGGDVKPTVPGWKVVVNPKHGSVFEVPPEWKVGSSGTMMGFEDKAGKTLAIMSSVAELKDKWCTDDGDKDGKQEDTTLSQSGTTGTITGAKNTAEVAQGQAGNWVFGGYAQEARDKVKVGKGEPYTTASGLEGSLSLATAIGVKKTSKCVTDGKAYAFSFKNAKGDFRTWILHSAKGVPDEVPDATVKKILSTVRLAAE